MIRRVPITIFSLLALGLFALPRPSLALPTGFHQTTFAQGLHSPTAMAFAPDGRLFVTEQGGKVRVIKNGSLLSTPFLTVGTTTAGERGLLGIAFDPKFAQNHYVYIYYTVAGSPAHNRVRRYTQSTTNPNVAISTSGRTIVDLDPLSSATNHNGGAIHFSKDGKLFIGVGENAKASNAQSLKTRFGKILRLNPDGTIPTDNFFYNKTTGANRAIWALGLRNPFTFAVDPGTGNIFINDVGQNSREEINLGRGGANYGWPTCEGKCSVAGMTNPLFAYSHNGTSAAITGGAFYRSSRFPTSYLGSYFFGDYLQGVIRRREPNSRVTTFVTNAQSPVDIQVGSDGNLYYLSIFAGKVFKISY